MKINKKNLDLLRFVTLTLKPLTKKLVEKLGDEVTCYYVGELDVTDQIVDQKKNSAGETYQLVKTYAVANVTDEVNSNGEFVDQQRRKVCILGSGKPVEGLYVALDDVLALKTKKLVALSPMTQSDD